MNIIERISDIIEELYRHGFDERNGGNLSYLLDNQELLELDLFSHITKTFKYNTDLTRLIGRYIVITATGSYFRNIKRYPKINLGILKVLDEHTLGLVWGYENDGRPTSEAPTHLKAHIARLSEDEWHRVVMHCHPINMIAMSHVHELESDSWTRDLWKMQTESIVVFPEGIAILPWMLCGGDDIGEATAAKMHGYRSVFWAQHGIFCTGTSLDETFGLIETIEKAAEIYMKIFDKDIKQSISNEQLVHLAKAFKVIYRKGIID